MGDVSWAITGDNRGESPPAPIIDSSCYSPKVFHGSTSTQWARRAPQPERERANPGHAAPGNAGPSHLGRPLAVAPASHPRHPGRDAARLPPGVGGAPRLHGGDGRVLDYL